MIDGLARRSLCWSLGLSLKNTFTSIKQGRRNKKQRNQGEVIKEWYEGAQNLELRAKNREVLICDVQDPGNNFPTSYLKMLT